MSVVLINTAVLISFDKLGKSFRYTTKSYYYIFLPFSLEATYNEVIFSRYTSNQRKLLIIANMKIKIYIFLISSFFL